MTVHIKNDTKLCFILKLSSIRSCLPVEIPYDKLKISNRYNEYMKSSTQNGFTLIELLIVVAIIGVLAAVGVPAYQGYITEAKRKATTQQHQMIVSFINASSVNCDIRGGSIPLKRHNGKDYMFRCFVDAGVWRNRMSTHFQGLGWKNPWNTPNPWTAGSPMCCRPHDGADFANRGITDLGVQSLTAVVVRTNIGGTTNNQLTTTINISGRR